MIRTPKFWYKKSGVLSLALSPLSVAYQAVSQRKINKTSRYTSKIPVLCIGNLTAGGSGKTPVVGALAQLFKQQGKKPHILSRGYGGKIRGTTKVNTDIHTAKEVGDEPFMHAKNNTCWVSPNRVQAAKMIENGGNADLIIMDDGFQNPDLKKNVSIVVVDGNVAFGNEHIIPAGPLREPIDEGIKRADALIIMGDDRHYLTERFSYLMPVFQGYLTPDTNTKIWSGKKIVGFTGIGRPEKFRQTLLSIGADIKDFIPFADHHFFSLSDINKLVRLSEKHDAQLVTTEKDWGRLPASHHSTITPIPVNVKWKDEKALKKFFEEKGL